MENNENFEIISENVEQTTEQTPKTYTEEEFNTKLNEVLGKKLARREAKIRKEYDRKYGDLEEVLKAGTGKESVEEITGTFRDFYTKKGIQFQQKPTYSDRDIQVLAQAEAEDIIRGGFDEVVEEVDRLTELGVANMTAKEKAMFKVLAEHRQSMERGHELSKICVTEDVYNSDDFKKFASQFNPSTPITDVFDIYRKSQPHKNIKTMGSIKNTESADDGVKDFYTIEEIKKFSKEDFDKNPKLWANVQKSLYDKRNR
jgi:hypothetical protein